MANGLSLVLEVIAGSDPNSTVSLQKGFSTGGPTILHYAWVVGLPSPDGKTRVLLSTVYDEDFTAYITDLVNANPALFNNAAPGIVGMNELVPIQDHMSEFVAFVKANDLTQGGSAYLGTFFEGYSWTVDQVLTNMGAGPGAVSAAKGD